MTENGADHLAGERAGRLGVVVEGSLVQGLKVRLDRETSVEAMRVGQFVKVRGERHDFFCLVTDVELGVTSQAIRQNPPSDRDGFLRQVLAGTNTYGSIKVQPMLMLDDARRNGGAADAEDGPRPVKTIPTHFSPVYVADQEDFGRVFGQEGPDYLAIGTPLDMDVPVCLSLERLVQRSNGVFGKSGTGKSFLTRLLLCGIIKANAAVNLVFDMHSEYGYTSQSEAGHQVKGLATLFPSTKIAVYTIDERAARDRSPRPLPIKIGLNEIEVEDIALLQDELRLNPTAVESAGLLVDRFGDDWIRQLLAMDPDGVREFCATSGAHHESVAALRRKLAELKRYPFIADRTDRSAIEALIKGLEDGRHVVLEFGQHRRLLPYMLVANVITRRIHRRWVDLTERYNQSQRPQDKPKQLMITIEEAHKFLNPQAARQTTFGTIARELRKFNVTLLVVDQRPSGIDPEVLSQLGTRITCQLNDDRDIEAIFSGVSGGSHLRSVLATLESRQQAMVLGHAVPMPVVVRTRDYDERFYQSLGPFGDVAARADPERLAELRDLLFGEND
jgi:DNA helicase HerA-like ATPase